MKERKSKEQVTQKRALETRQKIIETSLYVIANKGYHNTTVDEIAKEAGVSTGIAYRYFKNKKDILLSALDFAFQNIQQIFHTEDIVLEQFDSAREAILYVLEQFYMIHTKYYAIHEELEGMRHTDQDVMNFYAQIEENAIDALIAKCPEEIAGMADIRERIIFAINVLETYCHMAMDKKYEAMNKDLLKELAIEGAMVAFRKEIKSEI